MKEDTFLEGVRQLKEKTGAKGGRLLFALNNPSKTLAALNNPKPLAILSKDMKEVVTAARAKEVIDLVDDEDDTTPAKKKRRTGTFGTCVCVC